MKILRRRELKEREQGPPKASIGRSVRRAAGSVGVVFAASSLLATSVNAAISIDNSEVRCDTGLGATADLNYGAYDASSSEKLVVLVGTRRDRPNSLVTIVGVTYNGVAMTPAANLSTPFSSEDYSEAAAVFFLDNPGPGGEIKVQTNALAWGPDSGIAILALSGTEAGVAASNSAIGLTTSVTTVGADALVVAVNENTADERPNWCTSTVIPQPDLTDLIGQNIGAGYQFVPSATTVNTTFAGPGAVTAAAAFAAVPTRPGHPISVSGSHQPVPTSGVFGLGLLAGLLGIFGLRYSRRG